MEPEILHQAARQYLMRRYDELNGVYAQLPNQGRAMDGYHYTREARRIFPRYNIIEAMLGQVERLDPERLPDFADLSAALLRAANDAQSLINPQGKDEAEVIRDERQMFAAAIRGWTSESDIDVEPLGYRRVLTAEESSGWRQRLQERWGLQGLSWHPMLAAPLPDEVLVLQEAYMWDEQGVGRVRQVLQEAGGRRIAELREYGADYLVDVDLFAPRYTGAEGVWSDNGLTWIAYASHEGTVAFGGLLALPFPPDGPISADGTGPAGSRRLKADRYPTGRPGSGPGSTNGCTRTRHRPR
ncbi:hypothetical protein O7542_13870 [Micromonospora sp. WMMC264]|uniref:hypothetical protein n=1 Tax=Micromonospora sp. WMMC264 TaxID=3015158 RepID=UPI00248D23F6|nr:hypothetical protein [Micromonospora sp. WMMC264]WBB88190.1 hypothetical protein O7542_13870 [Micromonospora sp. WMMC264]